MFFRLKYSSFYGHLKGAPRMIHISTVGKPHMWGSIVVYAKQIRTSNSIFGLLNAHTASTHHDRSIRPNKLQFSAEIELLAIDRHE